jgi:aminopeptidase C
MQCRGDDIRCILIESIDEMSFRIYVMRHYLQALQANFLGFADSFEKGNYFGKETVDPSDVKIDMHTLLFMTIQLTHDM